MEFEVTDGYIKGRAAGGLIGGKVLFEKITVTGTENVLMAAALAQGETIIENAAREPEVTDLADCLVALGAKIEGIGTDTLCIQGVARLHGGTHRIIPDRIEAVLSHRRVMCLQAEHDRAPADRQSTSHITID